MSQVFISYSRDDKDFVDELIRQLESRGIDVWLDRKDIGGGKDWRAAISRAIRECSFFLLVLSPSSGGSKKVTQELALADQFSRTIIPIRHQDCEIPEEMSLQLASLQWVDFVENEYADALERLTHALQQAGGKPERPAALPAAATAPPSPPNALPAPAVPLLAQVLPGGWQVQIMHPLGAMATLTLEVAATGMFQGQLVKPTGVTAVQGQWQTTPLNEIVLQGQETNGLMFLPYMVMIRFQRVTPNQLTGATGAGEQVVWHRMR